MCARKSAEYEIGNPRDLRSIEIRLALSTTIVPTYDALRIVRIREKNKGLRREWEESIVN